VCLMVDEPIVDKATRGTQPETAASAKVKCDVMSCHLELLFQGYLTCSIACIGCLIALCCARTFASEKTH
jgi:hypothetical protein